MIAVLAAVLLALAPAAAQEAFRGVARVVAIGDIHGDFEALSGLLRGAGVMDAAENWTGGKTHVVQLGDVVDRGPDSRRCLDLLMALEKKARRAGGRLHALIGNHEAMNIYGDLRYVSPADYDAFRTEKSEKLRDMYYQRHVTELKTQGTEPDETYRNKWMATRPLGFFERLAALASDGVYGKWIVGNPASVKVNDMVFVHGGIGPKYAETSLKEINKKIAWELAEPGRVEGGMAIDPEGPLWYRGLAQGDEEALRPHVEGVLQRLEASTMVVGHTVTKGWITPRFGGQVLLVDTGNSKVYGSHSACLIVEGGKRYALHRGRKVELPRDAGPDAARYQNEIAAIEAGK